MSLGLFSFLLTSSLLFAAPLETVTNTNHAGPGSLRQAIADVNPGGEIVFNLPNAGPHTIFITDDLLISKSMTITGQGQNALTINGAGGMFRGIQVIDGLPTLITVTISGMTLDGGGTDFGGILNSENLTLNNTLVRGYGNAVVNFGASSEERERTILHLNNSLVTANSNIGVFSLSGQALSSPGGTVTINHTTISGNGDPGIVNNSALQNFTQGAIVVVNYSTISGNMTGIVNLGGQAIGAAGGIVEVNNSLIDQNIAPIITEGDGIVNAGGGFDGSTGGTLIVENSTISNHPGAGIIVGSAQVPGSTPSTSQISSSTLSGNKFALVYEPGTPPVVEVKNSIIANSLTQNCAADVTPITSLGVNIITDGSCEGFTTVSTAALNLGPLQNNGGPTDTFALVPPSAAIDVVSDCTFIDGAQVTEDQRGFFRPETNCDAGAFELGAPEFLPNSVPALSTWGAIITVICVGMVAIYYCRKTKLLA